MPYKSEKQRKYVEMKAKEGYGWAKKYKKHSGGSCAGGQSKGKKR